MPACSTLSRTKCEREAEHCSWKAGTGCRNRRCRLHTTPTACAGEDGCRWHRSPAVCRPVSSSTSASSMCRPLLTAAECRVHQRQCIWRKCRAANGTKMGCFPRRHGRPGPKHHEWIEDDDRPTTLDRLDGALRQLLEPEVDDASVLVDVYCAALRLWYPNLRNYVLLLPADFFLYLQQWRTDGRTNPGLAQMSSHIRVHAPQAIVMPCHVADGLWVLCVWLGPTKAHPEVLVIHYHHSAMATTTELVRDCLDDFFVNFYGHHQRVSYRSKRGHPVAIVRDSVLFLLRNVEWLLQTTPRIGNFGRGVPRPWLRRERRLVPPGDLRSRLRWFLLAQQSLLQQTATDITVQDFYRLFHRPILSLPRFDDQTFAESRLESAQRARPTPQRSADHWRAVERAAKWYLRIES